MLCCVNINVMLFDDNKLNNFTAIWQSVQQNTITKTQILNAVNDE